MRKIRVKKKKKKKRKKKREGHCHSLSLTVTGRELIGRCHRTLNQRQSAKSKWTGRKEEEVITEKERWCWGWWRWWRESCCCFSSASSTWTVSQPVSPGVWQLTVSESVSFSDTLAGGGSSDVCGGGGGLYSSDSGGGDDVGNIWPSGWQCSASRQWCFAAAAVDDGVERVNVGGAALVLTVSVPYSFE